MRKQRVAVLVPPPEDRFISLCDVPDIPQEPVENLEVLRCFGALGREQDFTLECVGRHWLRRRGPSDLCFQPGDAPLASLMQGGKVPRVEVRQRADGTGDHGTRDGGSRCSRCRQRQRSGESGESKRGASERKTETLRDAPRGDAYSRQRRVRPVREQHEKRGDEQSTEEERLARSR